MAPDQVRLAIPVEVIRGPHDDWRCWGDGEEETGVFSGLARAGVGGSAKGNGRRLLGSGCAADDTRVE
jgi:hypothetical protein